jgi:hypothetical protein
MEPRCSLPYSQEAGPYPEPLRSTEPQSSNDYSLPRQKSIPLNTHQTKTGRHPLVMKMTSDIKSLVDTGGSTRLGFLTSWPVERKTHAGRRHVCCGLYRQRLIRKCCLVFCPISCALISRTDFGTTDIMPYLAARLELVSGCAIIIYGHRSLRHHYKVKKLKLRGLGPLANYADRATAASWRSNTNFCG